MKKLYLIRHGETYFNRIGKSQGWCDSPLTEKGIEDARKARSYLINSNIEFDHGYSSSLGRARDSLEIIGKDYIGHTEAVKDLRELGFGRFEGESRDILPDIPFEDYFVKYGGESEKDAVKRFNKALIKIMDKDDHQWVLVVSHGTIIREFSRYWEKYSDLETMTLTKNGSIQIYDYSEGIFYLKDYIEP